MGTFFLFIAIQSVEDTVWNITTLLIAAIATLDFGLAIRLMMLHFKTSKKDNEAGTV
ncbi:YdiK family protein [Virgibacillus soli]|uniref:YdiK family protein n=2 Tax=Paracerasibacillus soli TaxID=480284 RepID=A0ABU5CVY0_9BACI|nr:YdiK family protein [Virgibacillus soli]MDY0410491.1 YdiK family protein [Virgibacillus soli]